MMDHVKWCSDRSEQQLDTVDTTNRATELRGSKPKTKEELTTRSRFPGHPYCLQEYVGCMRLIDVPHDMRIFWRNHGSRTSTNSRIYGMKPILATSLSFVVFKALITLLYGPEARMLVINDDYEVIPSSRRNATIAGAEFEHTLSPVRMEQFVTQEKDKPIPRKVSFLNNNDFICRKLQKRPIYRQIQIANRSQAAPKILCFIMSHSKATSKVQAVRKTWGRKCDKLLLASNETNPSIGAIKMESDATYLGLWSKLNETMAYIWNHFGDDQFDWVLKADDDTFVIMENLKEYLSSPSVVAKQSEPSIHGRRFSSPTYKDLEHDEYYFTHPRNVEFGKRFYAKMDRNASVIYDHGGSGYVMNMAYVKKFVQVMQGPDTVYETTPAEDMANGVVMAYHGIWPTNTRDELGRERFHPKITIFWSDDGETSRHV